MKKVIVHDGLFHADDVLSVALIHRFLGEVEVERKRTITPEEMDDPDVWVVDVGGCHNPETSCFDHHHDRNLPASCVLVLYRLLEIKAVRFEFCEEIKEAVTAISDIDRNGLSEFNGFQVNSLINSFNNIKDGFNYAIGVMGTFIESVMDTVNKIEESRILWDNGEQVNEGIKICTSYPIKWKEYEDSKFLIVPEKGDWKLLSKDSALYPIATNGKEKFLHAGKFIAVFLTKEDAIASAINSVNIKNHI